MNSNSEVEVGEVFRSREREEEESEMQEESEELKGRSEGELLTRRSMFGEYVSRSVSKIDLYF